MKPQRQFGASRADTVPLAQLTTEQRVIIVADAETIDEFELVNCIATGGTTQVWEVKQSGSGQTLAMKLLLPEAFKDPEMKKVLKFEATVGKSLEHPNIIKIFDIRFKKKHAYFTMEYFRSANLKSMIRGDQAGAQTRAKKLMECLAQALGFMHDKGWIHKDVKPDNVLLNKGGEVRLIDFSLAGKPSNAIVRAVTKKKNIPIQGTRTYLAPELIQREALTFAADMYSLGILFYEILTGNPPFRTARPNDLLMMHIKDTPVTPSLIDNNITPDVDKVIARMLAKKPKDRPASMHELYAELRGLKFFHEDPLEVHKSRAEEQKKSAVAEEDSRLNSRLDAERVAAGIAPPPKPKSARPVAKPVPPQPAAKAPAATAPPAQPQAPYPGYPPMGYPGMPMPGYPPMPPGMPMPGFPMPPGMAMPGYPMPGMPMPGYPGMPFPPQMPGQGMPPAAVPQQPVTGAVPPTPSTPVPTKPQPQTEPVEEDLPLADFDQLQIE